ncbi:MAG: rod shape-determining protein MreC [Saprospiraceae bacterium]
MRGLLLFLANNSSTFLFFFLEAVCFYLIVRFNDGQQRIYLSTANAFSGYLNKKSDDIYNYFSLDDQMEVLQRENALLRQKLQRMARAQGDSLLADTALSGTFAFFPTDSTGKDSLREDYTFIPAEVIDNSISNNDNTLTLNRGRKDGIEPHMGVINGDGVVGIVREVSDHYSMVMSILHRQTRISAAVKGTTAFGVLRWHGGDPRKMQLEDIPKHEIVEAGDTVVTTGYPLSHIFPKGIFIGVVDKAYVKQGENFYTVDVNLNISMGRTQHAYIVSLNHRKELLELQAQKPK